MTTPQRWQRVQELCEALEAVAPDDHRRRLEQLEPDDSLREETLALLDAMRDEERVQRERRATPAAPPPPPQSLGGVRRLEWIGTGGSGDVFRGVRTVNGVDQIVAIKRFHAHRAGPEQLDRFTREQRMLAALTHPDIVRFLDAGTTEDGRPFLVMDLAEGLPITAYCDHHDLGLDERLRLMRSVCDAVTSAHRHLIVHLDLKPSNILVSNDGRVKLLDFGTAKLVDPIADLTRTEPLTLQYASPERLRNEPVSVACDIYSLGLVLFELVSGGWPFRRRDSIVSVAERATGQSEMLPPSRVVSDESARRRGSTRDRLRSAVRGDLDAICAKALAQEPSNRYPAVADLAEDLRRHLAGEPVQARPPGVLYRTGKFVRRHVWGVAATVALVTGLTAATMYSTGQARAARRAASRAETQSRFLASLFTLTRADTNSRREMTMGEFLRLAESRIDPSLGSDSALAIDAQLVLAQGFLLQDAVPQARALLEKALRAATTSRDVVREASVRALLAFTAYLQNRTDEATSYALAATALWKRQPGLFTPAQAVTTLSNAAETLSYIRTTDPAHREFFEACLTIARAHPAEIGRAERARCLRGLAVAYTNIDARYDDADALLQEALAVQRADPSSVGSLAMTLQFSGLVNRYRGRFAEDEQAQREAYDILVRLNGKESVAAQWQRAVWLASLPAIGRGEESYGEAVELLSAARRVYPVRGSYLLWTPLFTAANAACMTRRYAECEVLAREALETLGPTPSDNDPRYHTARGFLGLALSARGQHAEARPLIEGAIAMIAARKRRPHYLPLLEAALAQSPAR